MNHFTDCKKYYVIVKGLRTGARFGARVYYTENSSRIRYKYPIEKMTFN